MHYYIEELDKQTRIEKIFSIIKVEGRKIKIPDLKNEYIKRNRRTLKIVNKIVRILETENIKNVVISNKVRENELLVNYLQTYGINIVDGKFLFEALMQSVLMYIIDKKKFDLDNTYISIAVNEPSDIVVQNIKNIIKEYKKVNIVTKYIEKFKKIEEDILEQTGKIISVSNNRKRSLAKSNIILNIDFPEEVLNKYNIFDQSVIVNFKQNVKITQKRFNGININNYDINCKNINININNSKKYMQKAVYEAGLSNKLLYKELLKKIQEDNVQIAYLQGNKAKI